MSIATRLWLSAAVIIAAIAAMVGVALWILQATDHITRERALARQTVLDSQRLLGSLLDAETGQRGYLLTGSDEYLAPYQRALQELPDAFAKLTADSSSIPELASRIPEIEEATRAKLDELKQTIALRAEQGLDAAAKIVVTGRGKAAMDRLRELVDEVETIGQGTIERREADLQYTNSWGRLVIALSIFLVLAVVILANSLVIASLKRPLAEIGKGIARVATGDLSRDIETRGNDELNRLGRTFNSMMADLRTERATRQRAEEAAAQSGAALKAHGLELERRAQSIDILGKMANRLLSCVNEAELQEVVRRYLPQIFPEMPGALYTLSNSQTLLRRVAAWNEESNSLEEFTPSQCWALRRGQPHSVSDASGDIMCEHLRPQGAGTHHCLPLVAQGESVGLLHLKEKAGLPPLEKDYLPVLTEAIASSVVNLRLREKLRNQSLRDPLTGLFNRRYLEESLELECARALRSGQPLSLAMMDVDHFKQFNDTFGHDAGDVVLKGFADLLRRLLRQGDVACRYGGEEFVVLLPATSAKDSLVVLERIRDAAQYLELTSNGQALGKISVSIGVAPYGPMTSSPASILEAADGAMYAAKRAGRNRIEAIAASAHEDAVGSTSAVV